MKRCAEWSDSSAEARPYHVCEQQLHLSLDLSSDNWNDWKIVGRADITLRLKPHFFDVSRNPRRSLMINLGNATAWNLQTKLRRRLIRARRACSKLREAKNNHHRQGYEAETQRKHATLEDAKQCAEMELSYAEKKRRKQQDILEGVTSEESAAKMRKALDDGGLPEGIRDDHVTEETMLKDRVLREYLAGEKAERGRRRSLAAMDGWLDGPAHCALEFDETGLVLGQISVNDCDVTPTYDRLMRAVVRPQLCYSTRPSEKSQYSLTDLGCCLRRDGICRVSAIEAGSQEVSSDEWFMVANQILGSLEESVDEMITTRAGLSTVGSVLDATKIRSLRDLDPLLLAEVSDLRARGEIEVPIPLEVLPQRWRRCVERFSEDYYAREKEELDSVMGSLSEIDADQMRRKLDAQVSKKWAELVNGLTIPTKSGWEDSSSTAPSENEDSGDGTPSPSASSSCFPGISMSDEQSKFTMESEVKISVNFMYPQIFGKVEPLPELVEELAKAKKAAKLAKAKGLDHETQDRRKRKVLSIASKVRKSRRKSVMDLSSEDSSKEEDTTMKFDIIQGIRVHGSEELKNLCILTLGDDWFPCIKGVKYPFVVSAEIDLTRSFLMDENMAQESDANDSNDVGSNTASSLSSSTMTKGKPKKKGLKRPIRKTRFDLVSSLGPAVRCLTRKQQAEQQRMMDALVGFDTMTKQSTKKKMNKPLPKPRQNLPSVSFDVVDGDPARKIPVADDDNNDDDKGEKGFETKENTIEIRNGGSVTENIDSILTANRAIKNRKRKLSEMIESESYLKIDEEDIPNDMDDCSLLMESTLTDPLLFQIKDEEESKSVSLGAYEFRSEGEVFARDVCLMISLNWTLLNAHRRKGMTHDQNRSSVFEEVCCLNPPKIPPKRSEDDKLRDDSRIPRTFGSRLECLSTMHSLSAAYSVMCEQLGMKNMHMTSLLKLRVLYLPDQILLRDAWFNTYGFICVNNLIIFGHSSLLNRRLSFDSTMKRFARISDAMACYLVSSMIRPSLNIWDARSSMSDIWLYFALMGYLKWQYLCVVFGHNHFEFQVMCKESRYAKFFDRSILYQPSDVPLSWNGWHQREHLMGVSSNLKTMSKNALCAITMLKNMIGLTGFSNHVLRHCLDLKCSDHNDGCMLAGMAPMVNTESIYDSLCEEFVELKDELRHFFDAMIYGDFNANLTISVDTKSKPRSAIVKCRDYNSLDGLSTEMSGNHPNKGGSLRRSVASRVPLRLFVRLMEPQVDQDSTLDSTADGESKEDENDRVLGEVASPLTDWLAIDKGECQIPFRKKDAKEKAALKKHDLHKAKIDTIDLDPYFTVKYRVCLVEFTNIHPVISQLFSCDSVMSQMQSLQAIRLYDAGILDKGHTLVLDYLMKLIRDSSMYYQIRLAAALVVSDQRWPVCMDEWTRTLLDYAKHLFQAWKEDDFSDPMDRDPRQSSGASCAAVRSSVLSKQDYLFLKGVMDLLCLNRSTDQYSLDEVVDFMSDCLVTLLEAALSLKSPDAVLEMTQACMKSCGRIELSTEDTFRIPQLREIFKSIMECRPQSETVESFAHASCGLVFNDASDDDLNKFVESQMPRIAIDPQCPLDARLAGFESLLWMAVRRSRSLRHQYPEPKGGDRKHMDAGHFLKRVLANLKSMDCVDLKLRMVDVMFDVFEKSKRMSYYQYRSMGFHFSDDDITAMNSVLANPTQNHNLESPYRFYAQSELFVNKQMTQQTEFAFFAEGLWFEMRQSLSNADWSLYFSLRRVWMLLFGKEVAGCVDDRFKQSHISSAVLSPWVDSVSRDQIAQLGQGLYDSSSRIRRAQLECHLRFGFVKQSHHLDYQY